MKQYRVTMTINVFIDAESEEDAQSKFDEMSYDFYDDDWKHYESMLIDTDDIVEVID